MNILFSKHYLKVWDLWNEIDKIFVQAWNWQQTDKVDEDFDAKKYKSEQISLHYGLNEWNKVSLAPGSIFWLY